METIRVRIAVDESARDIPLPMYMTEGAAGMDLPAAVTNEVVIPPGEYRLVDTGIYISIPPGFEAQVRPRSGLALTDGVTLLNSPGTIDSDYRGVIRVLLINHGSKPFVVKRGDRIAQLVFSPVVKAQLVQVDQLDDTLRGKGGFGHTGIGKI